MTQRIQSAEAIQGGKRDGFKVGGREKERGT